MIAASVPLLALLYLFASLAVLGRGKTGYSHFRHTISEIGEVGAPRQSFVAYALFLPVGAAFAALAWLLRDTGSAFAALPLCIAVGYLVAAFFPCDPGSPVSGSARQAVHNLGGGIEYIGGGLSLMALSERIAPWLRFPAFLVLGAAVALTVLSARAPRGLVQRIAEVCLFGSASFVIWWSVRGT